MDLDWLDIHPGESGNQANHSNNGQQQLWARFNLSPPAWQMSQQSSFWRVTGRQFQLEGSLARMELRREDGSTSTRLFFLGQESAKAEDIFDGMKAGMNSGAMRGDGSLSLPSSDPIPPLLATAAGLSQGRFASSDPPLSSTLISHRWMKNGPNVQCSTV